MRIRFLAVILIVITFVAYASSFGNQFVWDDEQFLYKNVFVREFAVGKIFTTSTTSGANTVSDYYRPFTTLSLSLDYQLWELNPFGFHLTNTALHAAAGVLIFVLLLRVGMPRFAAFAVSSIFVLHPIQTEAVVYVNSRGDSLSAFYGALAAHAYLSYIRKRVYTASLYNLQVRINATWLLILSVLLYIFAILSKEIGLAWGGIFFLLTHTQHTPQKLYQELRTTPLRVFSRLRGLFIAATAAASYLVLRATALNFDATFSSTGDGSLYYTNTMVRLLSFTKIVFTYFQLLLFPYPLHMERSSEVITSFASPWPWLFVLLVTSLGFLSYWEYKHKKTAWIAFGTLWFFALLVPTSGIIAINGMLYEHWLYLPQIGFWIVLGRIITLLPHSGHFINATKLLFLCLVLCVYAVLTMRQNYYWSTPIRFYEYLLQHTDSARIHNNLGMAYAEAGRPRDAIVSYKRALEYSIPYPQIYHNLGNTLTEVGEYQQAEAAYREALTNNPSFSNAYFGLLALYQKSEQPEAALATVREAQTQLPGDYRFYLLEIELQETLTPEEKQTIRSKAKAAFPNAPQLHLQMEQLLSTR